MEITYEDVYMTLGIPMGSKVVEEATSMDTNLEYQQLFNQQKSQWSSEESLCTTKILKKMEDQKDGGDNFITNFVVFVVSRLIKEQQNLKPNHKILKALVNIEEIRDLNWCEYTWKSLVTCTRDWKKKSGAYKGPMLFLMMCYLDRVVHEYRTVDRKFPTLFTQTAGKI